MWDAFDQITEGAIPDTVKTVIQSSLTPWFSDEPEKEELVSPDGKILYLEDLIHNTEPNPPKIKADLESTVKNFEACPDNLIVNCGL